MNDNYIVKYGKKLRCGYTTGSCAAGAAKAAAKMLLSREKLEKISIDTPAGIILNLELLDIHIEEDHAYCCIVKDAGDDPDSTDKIKIYARVSKREDSKIIIDGGEGIGRITRSGFWGKSGAAAINPVPRKMITDELLKVSNCGFNVLIYAPEGKEISKKTFNSNLGIIGGISIIGTKGIVEPMSDEALKKSIYIEIDDAYDKGQREIVLFLGNYGEKVVEDLNLKGAKIKISNFIGDMLLYSKNKGFDKIILVGHIGKLCKLSIGAFNTHSKICDVRIEAFVYYLALNSATIELINCVNECKTSEEALKLIIDNNYPVVINEMIAGCVERIKRYLKDEDGESNIHVIMYSMEYGILGGKL
ncbi:cobalt-precorrin-5B (C(1))-methyltransferase CbiD [Clostridium bowmanii]|uniref:cobalt-precorrin-5B (C(1))-methyltransferase CbiD n=1 Tax=Clostridium bowmanii TaxID=132925 RepID=UPI001C0AF046|nr:cobalt-precorrin-5B (C(1))-methyltransferase CbiD [Clostridium bowmanii]MBU3190234.1 cobalt-precorrin-5B (C(1))-methyltransferase CbiD [Clostridium bowmanii]MCA1074791.1 cobalt-precorrin-5B (C(1))-methyltransferase CbiD [Clostridium bowmanii]